MLNLPPDVIKLVIKYIYVPVYKPVDWARYSVHMCSSSILSKIPQAYHMINKQALWLEKDACTNLMVNSNPRAFKYWINILASTLDNFDTTHINWKKLGTNTNSRFLMWLADNIIELLNDDKSCPYKKPVIDINIVCINLINNSNPLSIAPLCSIHKLTNKFIGIVYGLDAKHKIALYRKARIDPDYPEIANDPVINSHIETFRSDTILGIPDKEFFYRQFNYCKSMGLDINWAYVCSNPSDFAMSELDNEALKLNKSNKFNKCIKPNILSSNPHPIALKWVKLEKNPDRKDGWVANPNEKILDCLGGFPSDTIIKANLIKLATNPADWAIKLITPFCLDVFSKINLELESEERNLLKALCNNPNPRAIDIVISVFLSGFPTIFIRESLKTINKNNELLEMIIRRPEAWMVDKEKTTQEFNNTIKYLLDS